MGEVRVTFNGPQRFDAVTVTEMTVQADQLVSLHRGQQVLNVTAESVRTLETGDGAGGRLERLRAKHPNHGKPWTADEDAQLTARFRAGARPAELAEEFGRSRGAVRSALLRLGLVERAAPERPV
ncbi:hypothetical protein [Actinomadura sp. WAC 06369]|uniref:hypothetical protein n=1 Tax=Actinomadura sp. WAC 06369 TaxID=2203193 RepID=UPI000F775E5F|nr:hypothetical protein [Actinomadura sp. WAC 06369]RSN51761.1 hypothetical protein DMH08_30020 [Actinomadura sp. WAC 06369]